MGATANPALIATAFQQLSTAAKVDAALARINSLEDLTKHFSALPWDEKVFTVRDGKGGAWAVDVFKDGPTLTINPTMPELDGTFRVEGDSFWKHLVAAVEAAHPGHRLQRPESAVERWLHEQPNESQQLERAEARHKDEALREHRLKMREMQKQRDLQFRESKATNDRYLYWLWYQ